jgi:hypothetical protein
MSVLKCTCWPFICGDCCAYAGCLYHDPHCGSTFEKCAANFWQFFIGGCLPTWPWSTKQFGALTRAGNRSPPSIQRSGGTLTRCSMSS